MRFDPILPPMSSQQDQAKISVTRLYGTLRAVFVGQTLLELCLLVDDGLVVVVDDGSVFLSLCRFSKNESASVALRRQNMTNDVMTVSMPDVITTIFFGANNFEVATSTNTHKQNSSWETTNKQLTPEQL